MLLLKNFFVEFSDSPTPLRILILFLLGALFLGDGKQAFVEVYMGVGILCAYGLLWYRKIPLAPLPRTIGFLWIATIGYFIIRTIFSDSVGYSISTTIRMIEAYLVFSLFYSFATTKTQEWMWKFLLFLCFSAGCVFIFFLIVPSLATFLPTMNLLYSSGRHNHLADLLLFVLPGVTFAFSRRKDRAASLLFLFFMGIFFLTFARGAWILHSGFLLVYVFFSHQLSQKRKAMLLVAGGVFVVFFLIVTLGFSFPLLKDSWIIKQTTRTPIVQEARFEYWRQAAVAIKERPWFGGGPGTFYLQSVRLQVAPRSYSWFAHSFPLQLLVELGVIGFIPLLFLVVILARHVFLVFFGANRHTSIVQESLVWGALLTFAYSGYEFNLDYLVVWIVLCATIAVLLKPDRQQGGRIVEIWCFVLLFVFVFLSFVSFVVDGVGYKKESVLLAPYYSQRALVEDSSGMIVTPGSLRFYEFFHAKEPDVLGAIANSKQAKKETVDVEEYFKKSIRLDPKNRLFYQNYLTFLLETNQQAEFLITLSEMAESLLQTKAFVPKVSLPMPDSLLRSVVDAISKTDDVSLGFAKAYYLIGLEYMDIQPNLTRSAWSVSTMLSPTWSYFYIERASLEKYVFHNNALARDLLVVECVAYPSPRKLCQQVSRGNLSLPGYYLEHIKAAPSKYTNTKPL